MPPGPSALYRARRDAGVTNGTVVYKTKNGKCTQDPSLLRQEFVGNEFVGPGEWALMMTDKYGIPCEKGGL
ncbi:hypothetical protein [Sorangium sp. So ce1078]|uniref:hypothetical protein n=1 Tax=Sorangium sp. So ce1078 TaxID=3133329 RepID=UPI003F616198